jgi:hypothetical protein
MVCEISEPAGFLVAVVAGLVRGIGFVPRAVLVIVLSVYLVVDDVRGIFR